MHTTCLGRGWILCECKTRKFRLLSQFLQVGPFKQITFHWVGTDRKGQRKGVNKSTELKDGRESTHFWVFQSTASDGKWKICEMNKTWNFQPISRSVLLIQYCPHLYWSSIRHLSKGCHTLRAAQIIHECSLNVNSSYPPFNINIVAFRTPPFKSDYVQRMTVWWREK